MSPRPLPGFRLKIRCNAVLSALVHFYTDAAQTQPFDLTGYTALLSSVKQTLVDVTPLMTITALVSDVGLDANGNQIAVTPLDGWVQFYADTTETDNGQTIAEISPSASVRAFVDLLGFDSEGNLQPVAFGYADLLPGVT